jgi:hypothetical protein
MVYLEKVGSTKEREKVKACRGKLRRQEEGGFCCLYPGSLFLLGLLGDPILHVTTTIHAVMALAILLLGPGLYYHVKGHQVTFGESKR